MQTQPLQPTRQGFHPSKEGFKVGYRIVLHDRVGIVSIPLRKVSRGQMVLPFHPSGRVSIPLRKVSRFPPPIISTPKTPWFPSL